jgi:hypothetical protein
VFGVNEALWRVEWVSSVGRSNSDRSARAKLRLFGVRRGQDAEAGIAHRGIAAVPVVRAHNAALAIVVIGEQTRHSGEH